MRITFRGWGREVYPHGHDVTPVKKDFNGRFTPIERRKSVVFSDGMTAFGKFHDLELTGNFLAVFEFTEAELRSWLMSYFEKSPELAQKLISKVLADVAEAQVKDQKRSSTKYAKLEEKLARTSEKMQRAVDELHEQWLGTEPGSIAEKQIEKIMKPLEKHLEDDD